MKILTNEDKLKYELDICNLAFEYAIDHCMTSYPFPIDYKNGELEEPWDKTKWIGWFKSKAEINK